VPVHAAPLALTHSPPALAHMPRGGASARRLFYLSIIIMRVHMTLHPRGAIPFHVTARDRPGPA